MKLADAMIVWTPDTENFAGYPTRGTIAVTTMPESKELKVHPASAGVCELNWREADHNGRQDLLQGLFTTIIHQDRLPEDAVREALSKIDDVDTTSLNAAPPAK